MWNCFVCRKFGKIEINISLHATFVCFFILNNSVAVQGFRLLDVLYLCP